MSMRRFVFIGLDVGALVIVGALAIVGAMAVVVGGCASGQPPDGETCGNGRIDPGELCDTTNLGGFTCETLPGLGFSGGQLACGVDCSMDTSACTGGGGVCGNDVRDGTELCDGEDLGGETCLSQGMVAGTLLCLPDCGSFDLIRCTISETCGNGLRDGPEQCDQSDLAGATCEILGYEGGTLDCQASCLFDESGCGVDLCGNSIIEVGEDCDASNLDDETCVSLGLDDGTLTCTAGCAFDTTGCTTEVCGDGTADVGEQCDGMDFAGEDCVSQGFADGSLVCTATCAIDTTGCTNATCGDGVVGAGEECDDGGTSGGDGCNATCQWENTCSPDDTLTCGQTISNVSGVSGNDVSNNSCNGWNTNDDRVYAFTAAANGNATASVNCDDMAMDYDLYILEGACNPGLCLDYSVASGCNSVNFPVAAGLTYYIVVEYYLNEGFDDNFDISLSCS